MNSWTTLAFTSLDPCRTTLVDQDHKVVYSISTDEPLKTSPVTSYVDASGITFASLEWHMYRADKIQLLPDGEKVAVDKWLKKEKVKENGVKHIEMSFDFYNEKYTWKGFEENGPLRMYAGEENLINFTPAVNGAKKGDPPVEFAKIHLSPRLSAMGGAQNRNLAILSLLIILKALRFNGSVESSPWVSMGYAPSMFSLVMSTN